MIECPTCGNTAFEIASTPTAGNVDEFAHVITCTRCRAAWTLEFEDSEDDDLETDVPENPEDGISGRA